jgi:invasion protein IalB
LALALAGGAAEAQSTSPQPTAAAAEPPTTYTIGAWLVGCIDAGTETARCETAQRVVDQQGAQQILSASILAGRDAPPTEIVFTTPLGVWLEPGAVLAFPSAGMTRQLDYERCQPNGCMLHVALDEPLRAAIEAGGVAELRFADRLRQPLAAPVALDGLLDALAKMETETAPPKAPGLFSWFPWFKQ